MTRRRAAGVTLLELLLAVSLLSLLSTGMLMALHVGVNAMEKSNTRLMDNRRVAGTQRLLEQEIAGFIPVLAECVPDGDRPPATPKVGPRNRCRNMRGGPLRRASTHTVAPRLCIIRPRRTNSISRLSSAARLIDD